MAQHPHIPKFGSWDGDDNVPYTAYFESARKEKGSGVRMNPNDPEQNPEAFMMFQGGNDAYSDRIVSAEKNRKNSGSMKSMTSEYSSDKSTSDHSVLQSSYKSELKKSANERASNFYPPSPGPHRPKQGYNPADDMVSQRSASIPVFGAWDDRDPKSGDGFTVIFQKVKEEKQIAATTFPPLPQQHTNIAVSHEKESKSSKRCCCLF